MELHLEWLVCTTYEEIGFQPESSRVANCRVADPALLGSSHTFPPRGSHNLRGLISGAVSCSCRIPLGMTEE